MNHQKINLEMDKLEKDKFLKEFTGRWHDKLIDILQTWPRGKVLDIPCETGRLGRKLQALGFQVVCSDINPSYFQQKNITFHQANLNQILPFENNTYDYIVCAEGIEHIEDQYQMIREFARVLKPSGFLVLTTPNLLSLKARWKFLTRGAFAMFRDYTDNPDGNYLRRTGHINPVTFSELKYMLQRYGFDVKKIYTNRYVGENNIFYRILGRMIKPRTLKKNRYAPVLLKRELLYGEHLIVTAQRRN